MNWWNRLARTISKYEANGFLTDTEFRIRRYWLDCRNKDQQRSAKKHAHSHKRHSSGGLHTHSTPCPGFNWTFLKPAVAKSLLPWPAFVFSGAELSSGRTRRPGDTRDGGAGASGDTLILMMKLPTASFSSCGLAMQTNVPCLYTCWSIQWI